MNSPKIVLRETHYKTKYKENLLAVNLKNLYSDRNDRIDDIVYLASEISQLIAKILFDATVYVEISRLFKITLNKSIEFLQIIIAENVFNKEYLLENDANKSSLFEYLFNEQFSYINFHGPSDLNLCLDEFLTIPLKNLTVPAAEVVGHSIKQLTPHVLLSTPTEMFWDAVPLPTPGCRTHMNSFIFSQSLYDIPDNDPANLLAIDCEMVNTGNEDELELARISVVRCCRSADLKTPKGIKQWLSLSKNSAYEIVYDNLVKPKRKVVDYLTKYSGITEKSLENVETTLQDVHTKLKDVIKSNTILVGHSIQSDLKALKLYHPYIIDTSTIYNISGDFTRKPGLKSLSSEILKQEIRKTGKKVGHDSIEDAQTALRLVILKLSKDLNFGNKTRPLYTPPASTGDQRINASMPEDKSSKSNHDLESNFIQTKQKEIFKYILENDERNNQLNSIENMDIQMKIDQFSLLKQRPAVVKSTDLLYKLQMKLEIIVNQHGLVGRQIENPCQTVNKVPNDEEVVKETILKSRISDVVISVLSDTSNENMPMDSEPNENNLFTIRKNIQRIVNGIPQRSAIFVILPGTSELESIGKFFWKIS